MAFWSSGILADRATVISDRASAISDQAIVISDRAIVMSEKPLPSPTEPLPYPTEQLSYTTKPVAGVGLHLESMPCCVYTENLLYKLWLLDNLCMLDKPRRGHSQPRRPVGMSSATVECKCHPTKLSSDTCPHARVVHNSYIIYI